MLSKTWHVNLYRYQRATKSLGACLNRLHYSHLKALFPNLGVCTLPATVASVERSFNQLKRKKNYTLSTMTQGRLLGLSLLCIESDLARTVNYDSVISLFASRKDRKAPL